MWCVNYLLIFPCPLVVRIFRATWAPWGSWMVHPRPHFLPILFFSHVMYIFFSPDLLFIVSIESILVSCIYSTVNWNICKGSRMGILSFFLKSTSSKWKSFLGGMMEDKKKIIQFHRLCTLANTGLWCLILILWAAVLHSWKWLKKRLSSPWPL